MSVLASPQEFVTDAFRQAMRRMSSTVTVVTATDGQRRHGMTMTAVSSLSMDPPALLACVNRSTYLADILISARHFCINVLRHDQVAVSSAFSGALSSQERFAVGSWATHTVGVDLLEAAQANMVCGKTAVFPYGSHLIVIGNVIDVIQAEPAATADEIRPLLYCNAGYR
ncbi:flavin reductase family protein [Herbaspirillum rubrisubalbicans]|uniref:flavin reductase family protein n=1 Tax=Herbaspirillum rubrisubalbicans TaxID=80842 RepID=UPI001559D53B|nr:flavin reductase family protein [Herbaspirillum rubrisubalbicans]NQE49974.1 4-hydroxyphenylacetate 3-monooxygenase [Herbaspirillum rubrisubalbicans]